MPAKDKYHDSVVRALEKEGWEILADPLTLYIPGQHLYIDLQIQKESTTRLIEVKVFDGYPSQVDYLGNTLGQYLLYQVMVDLLDWDTPVYLAAPTSAFQGILSRPLARQALQRLHAKLLIYDPITEEIVQWID